MNTQTMPRDVVMTDPWETRSLLYDWPMWDEVPELEDFLYWEVVSDNFIHSNGAVPPAPPYVPTNVLTGSPLVKR